MDAAVRGYRDFVGLGWRPEYAASILCHIEEIDIIEVITDNFLRDNRTTKSLRTLAAQVPTTLHSVSLGMASSLPVEAKRLDNLARLFDICAPHSWSEHFSFVRAGGYEIGHLAAPPRNDETIEGTVKNIRLAKRVIGIAPLLENVATLVRPPFSPYSEWVWMDRILENAPCNLLLDLHNLLANCLNFGDEPFEVMRKLPLERVGLVHLSGGKWIKNPKNEDRRHLLDDHLHDVPDVVFELLACTAELCPNSISVIIERDGNYPSFDAVLGEVRRARQALIRGRVRRQEASVRRQSMNTAKLETFLARLYSDRTFLAHFLRAPCEVLACENFTAAQERDLLAIDESELILAARSYLSKRDVTKKCGVTGYGATTDGSR